MVKLVKRGTLVVLAFFLLSCVGVGAGMRMALVAAAFFGGGLSILLMIAVYLIAGHIRTRGAEKRAAVLQSGSPDPIQEEKHRLARRYAHMLGQLHVPGDAVMTAMASDLFSPSVVNLLHYFWITEDELLFFPRWDSIESSLELLEYLEKNEGQHCIRLNALRIPRRSVRFYALQPFLRDSDNYTLLRYAGPLDEDIALVLDAEAYGPLAKALPGLDLGELRERLYPASAQQIGDINAKMLQLKELYAQTLITGDEYTAKKAQLLVML